MAFSTRSKTKEIDKAIANLIQTLADVDANDITG
jgi:hypothetical protein